MINFTPKLIVFDLNDTLIRESTWHTLSAMMGVTYEEDQMFLKWYQEGIITYEEWVRFFCRIYKERGNATRKYMKPIICKYTYHNGAKETVKYLQRKGYELAIVTGSFDIQAKIVADDLGIELYRAHNTIIFDKKGRMVNIECVGDEADYKLEQLYNFCAEKKIDPTDVMCVGDGFNDEKMFIACKHGVTFKGKEVERSSWGVISELADLREVL